jgi:hypothetical protein
MPEAWDINLSSSMNHCMLGHIQQWFWQALAGIRPDPAVPGFKAIQITPDIDGTVDAVKGTYSSAYGEITCAWERQDKHVKMDVTIPVNTTARIYLPAVCPDHVSENNIALPESDLKFSMESRKLVVPVGSGRYSFSITLSRNN